MAIVIVEYTVQVIGKSEAETERKMLDLMCDSLNTWQRSKTPTRVLIKDN
jgi:hypothetical protein